MGKFLWLDKEKNEFLDLVQQGKSIKQALDELELNEKGFFDACLKDKEFEERYEMVTKHGLKMLASSLLDEIEDESRDIQRVKLKVEHTRWLLSRLLPQTYGDKIKVEVEHIDISGALQEAKKRVDVPPNTIDLKNTDLTSKNEIPLTDYRVIEKTSLESKLDSLESMPDHNLDTENQ